MEAPQISMRSRYQTFVDKHLLGYFWVVEVPMFGLTMGRQMSWLAGRI